MLIFNEDPDARVYRVEAGTMTEEALYPITDALRGRKTGLFFVCVNAMKANFPSCVLQPFTDGFDPSLGPDQPYMNGERSEWGFRRAANFLALERAGVDSNAVLLDRAREAGIPCGVSVRMNDQHGLWLKKSLMMSDFYLSHPEYHIRHMPPEPALDFSHAAVRDLMTAFLEEVLERYEPAWLELDFMRHPPYFDVGHGREHCACLTELAENARRLADRTAARCGHPIRVAAAVPSGIGFALDYGMDAADWARRGLIDLLILCPKYIRDITIDPGPWKTAIGRPDFPVAVRVERACQAYPAAPLHSAPLDKVRTPADELARLTRGAAWSAFARGADAVELFNYMGIGKNPQTAVLLDECASAEGLRGRDRSFFLSYNDLDMSDWLFFPGWRRDGVFDRWTELTLRRGEYPYALPRPLRPGEWESFRFASGPCTEEGLRLSAEFEGLPEDAQVQIAGADCVLRGGVWEAPAELYPPEDVTVRVRAAESGRVTAACLHVRFPAEGAAE